MQETHPPTAVVRLPTPLRRLVGGADQLEVSARTVGELLDGLVEQHPELRAHLLDDAGELRRFVNVYVGRDDIRSLDGKATELGVGAEVAIVPAVAGGAR
ncbi:MAG: ubiquitin-like small modifier protein 1 [Planctomycetota bacterium]|jgi:molybdopterin synthase sulfur carrier subunit